MPIHTWNWFRAVGVGNDLKSWYGDTPQVEDGREGGNQEFEDGISDQYEDEVRQCVEVEIEIMSSPLRSTT